jgi:uncharacterized membrane protein YccF (DUF307 family)
MSVLLNIIWLLCGGLIAGLVYIIGGLLLCVTIVGIPFGMQAMRLGVAVFAPFGRHAVRDRMHQGFLALAFDVIWLVLFGWEIAVMHLVGGAVLCLTIVGIPFGVQLFKLVPVALFPFTYTMRQGD